MEVKAGATLAPIKLKPDTSSIHKIRINTKKKGASPDMMTPSTQLSTLHTHTYRNTSRAILTLGRGNYSNGSNEKPMVGGT
jgi:hypothetical protein